MLFGISTNSEVVPFYMTMTLQNLHGEIDVSTCFYTNTGNDISKLNKNNKDGGKAGKRDDHFNPEELTKASQLLLVLLKVNYTFKWTL